MNTVYRGQEAEIVKENVYCKAGAYEHKAKSGWVVVVDGEIVFGDRPDTQSGYGAYRHECPKYKTRKSLVEDLVQINARYNKFIERKNAAD